MKDRLFVVPKTYLCKHCKVQVVGPNDLRPIFGRAHKKGCPRRKYNS